MRVLLFQASVPLIVLLSVSLLSGEEPQEKISSLPSETFTGDRIENVAFKAERLFSRDRKAFPPIEQRSMLVDRMEEALENSKPPVESEIEVHVSAWVKCASILSSIDMGVSDRRHQVRQRMIARCLPYVNKVPDRLAMEIFLLLSQSLDLEGNKLHEGTRSGYRNLYVEHHLKLWQRLDSRIDPTWNINDPENVTYLNLSPRSGNYLPGTPPERIVEPEIRIDYELRLAENRRRSKRNTQQLMARHNKREWEILNLKHVMIRFYGRIPVSEQDQQTFRDMLETYLSEKQLRQELLAMCADNFNSTEGKPIVRESKRAQPFGRVTGRRPVQSEEKE